MPFIDQSVIEEIKFRCNIEDVISSYVTLKRAGSNYQGLCPFHSERTPSFTVFPSTSNFYCFGCGAGGDVINFIRRAENLDYPSAVELLAKRAGIQITRSKREKEEGARRERILSMNKEAARYFHKMLFAPEGRAGLHYLTEVRKLPITLIRHFGLGFAPDDFGALTNYLKSKGYLDSEMSSGFLCGISQKTGRPYDYFRNRVIFPIIATTGDVIAFGGRVMDDSMPKYLNSSDTPAFKKSKNLFALNFAKNSDLSTMILCEGYMDVIALHGAGFTNAVATLGTAITPEQARLFKRYTSKVVICYDADEAGQRAASKAFKLLGEAGVECRILKVENAKDPDEYIRKFGAGAFKNLLERSKGEFEFKFDQVLAKNDISTTDGKVKALERTVEIIASFYSAAKREVYIHIAAEQLGVTPESLKRDVDKSIKRRSFLEKQEEKHSILRQSEGYGDRVNPDFVKNPKAASAEEAIIGILLLHPEYLPGLAQKGSLPAAEDFVTAFGRKVYTLLLENASSGQLEEGVLGEALDVDEMSRITKMKLKRSELPNNSEKVLTECIATLKGAAEKDKLDIADIIHLKRQKRES